MPPQNVLAAVSTSVPAPNLVRPPTPPIVPPSVALLPLVSTAPPPASSVVPRLEVKPARNCSVPPPKVSPPEALPQVGVGANGQRPGVDHRASLVGVAASEDDLTRARLHERARYGNNATEGGSIGAIDSKATVATNVADGTTVADLQHSAAYDCRPGITIGT